MFNWFALGLAALAGSLMAVQGTLNARLGESAGLWVMVAVVNILGALIAITALVSPVGTFSSARLLKAPWYLWLGGPAGVAIVYGVARSIPRVGVVAATTAIILAQLITAAVIDHLGLFGMDRLPFRLIKTLGIVLMGIGAWVLLRRT